MALLKQKDQEKYTYRDYLTWDDNERYEIVGGEAFCMSPAPASFHQVACSKLITKLTNFFEGKSCTPLVSPIDVVLSEDNIVQPDVLIVCDKNKIKERGIFGVPDVVFEILSPSTATYDRREKKLLYEKFGVKEYLIVDPIGKNIEQFILEDGAFKNPELIAFKEILKLNTFPGLEIPLQDIFWLVESN
jgi:Uma2 family endonuclease